MKQVNKINWSHPGENRYTGRIADAIRSYSDIPPDVADRIITKHEARTPDDVVEIDAAGIRGKHYGYINLRQMFFGTNIRADVVDRSEWPFDLLERGLVYIEGNVVVLIPLVCGNVARVDHVPLSAVPPVSPHAYIPNRPSNQRIFRLGRKVPEPSSVALVLPALLAAFILRRRNGNKGHSQS